MMNSLEELYQRMLPEAAKGKALRPEEADEHQLDCLLHPEKHPLVIRTGACACSPEKQKDCAASCDFQAITPGEAGQGIVIDDTKCVGCYKCIDACKAQKLTASKDILAVLETLRTYDGPVYALVAPAVAGQFGPEVTNGKLRTALKNMGFAGMIEVAIFADILTLKEALEFDKNINSEEAYQLTSCCCPMWIAMIKKLYHQLLPNVPGTVSPMIAGGRTVKALYPKAKTVFIGPCLAKKAERREPDIADAVDYVLTYQELRDVFEALEVNLAGLEETVREHSSQAGIIYAFAGGVSEAVTHTVEKLNPHRTIKIKTRTADGVPHCKAMINDILAGKREGNFFEGMGCVGGCVGGPKAIIPKEQGKEQVRAYANLSQYQTPMENPYLIELLGQLGFKTVEEFLEKSDMYSRKFE
jgi:iron only hydrogenase large subunit-like protein